MWSAIRLFLALRPRSWVDVVGLAGLSLLVTATYVGQGLLIADVLAGVFSSIELGSLVSRLAAIGVLQLARIGLIVVKEWWAPRVSARVKEAVREGITVKLMEIGPGQAQRMRTGDLQSTLVDSVELLDPLVGRFVPSVIASILGSCLASVYVIAVDPVVGLIVLACALFAPLSKVLGEKWISPRGDRWTPRCRCAMIDRARYYAAGSISTPTKGRRTKRDTENTVAIARLSQIPGRK
ncbi:ABC transporter transmembrane domain-containing protein [Mycolicibacterium nivoides]|uniref:ABC transporter transmembrane domain-containing protein n=1 Tax=Mycolicibacterium nivoides TaxID=2487344 RepID=UPI003C2F0706